MTASQRQLQRCIYLRKSFTFLTCDVMLKKNDFFFLYLLGKGLQAHRINSKFYFLLWSNSNTVNQQKVVKGTLRS